MQKILSFIKGHKKAFWGIYLVSGIWIYAELYLGESFFYTTVYTYSLTGVISYFIIKRLNVSANVSLAWFTLLIALFAAEFTLRYVIRYPISYGEQNGDVYILTDRYQQYEDLWIRYIKGRPDAYTLEPDSGEVKDNDVGDYHYKNDTFNALGFRGKLPVGNKKIILVMGDSFTEGCGAPADSSIPALLRAYVAAHDTGTDVINCGVSGNDIFFDWMMLQKLARKYQVKQVDFMINSTDINDVGERGGIERFISNGMLRYNTHPWWEPVFAVSYVFRLGVMKLHDFDYTLRSPAEKEQINALAIEKITGLLKADILPWAKSKNIDVVVTTFPAGRELHTPLTSYKTLVNKLKGVKGCMVIDCLPELEAQPSPRQLYWAHDLHYNSTGYSIISGLIIDSCYRTRN